MFTVAEQNLSHCWIHWRMRKTTKTVALKAQKQWTVMRAMYCRWDWPWWQEKKNISIQRQLN